MHRSHHPYLIYQKHWGAVSKVLAQRGCRWHSGTPAKLSPWELPDDDAVPVGHPIILVIDIEKRLTYSLAQLITDYLSAGEVPLPRKDLIPTVQGKPKRRKTTLPLNISEYNSNHSLRNNNQFTHMNNPADKELTPEESAILPPDAPKLEPMKDEDIKVGVQEHGMVDRILTGDDEPKDLTFEEWWTREGVRHLGMQMTRAEIKLLAQGAYARGGGRTQDILVSISNLVESIEVDKAKDPIAHMQVRQLRTMVDKELRSMIG